jgi:SOS-response transcriptional repressor LexA
LRSIARALGIDFEKLRHQMQRDNLHQKLEKLRAEFGDVMDEGERIEIFSGQAAVGAAILSDITTVPMLDSVPVSAHDLPGEGTVRCPLPPGVEIDAENSFAVWVTGEDMADDKVDEGDIVVVDFKTKARDGDVVLATVSGQPVLRKIYRRGKTTVLQASTEREESVIFLSKSDEFEILGRMVLCIKLFTP